MNRRCFLTGAACALALLLAPAGARSEGFVRLYNGTDLSGWHVQEVDGLDQDKIARALRKARNVTDKPSMIACKTVIGYGAPTKAGTAADQLIEVGEGVDSSAQGKPLTHVAPGLVTRDRGHVDAQVDAGDGRAVDGHRPAHLARAPDRLVVLAEQDLFHAVADLRP